MKSILNIVPIVCLLNAFAMAGNGLLIGAGVNISDISYSEDYPDGTSSSMRIGYNVGLAYEFGFTPLFSVVPGIAVETRGHTLESSDPFLGTYTVDANLLYLEVPILAQVNVPAGLMTLHAFAGPEFGLLLSAKAKPSEGPEADFKDETAALDIGINLGIGLDIPVGLGAISVRPSYSIGLTNIDDSDPVPVDPDFPDVTEPAVEAKNRNIKIALYYKLPL